MCKSASVSLVLLLFIGWKSVWSAELSGHFALEPRIFPQSPLAAVQHGTENISVIAQPEFYHEWADGDMSLTMTPYLRWDQHDSERTHVDLREFLWLVLGDQWELRIGLGRIFWGVTESQHLVDVINQTDLVEAPDGEDKLGQPMVNITWIRNWGTLNFFVLPFFRERTFPGEEGRLRFPLPVATDMAVYESEAEQHHVDLALRWSHTLGDFDIGVSHFYGTNREPRLAPGIQPSGNPVLIPHYDLIHQTGLDVQWTQGGWLWKLEVQSRAGSGDNSPISRFTALTGGFEYTFGNVRNTGIDVGIVGEYLFDDRRDRATTPFSDDLFLGVRLALNDVQNTNLLAGGIIDRETGTSNIGVEASRRLWENWTIDLEIRSIIGTKENRPLHSFRKDDYIQVQLARHF